LLARENGNVVCRRCGVGNHTKVVTPKNGEKKEEPQVQIKQVNTVEELIENSEKAYIEKWDLTLYAAQPGIQPTEDVLSNFWKYRCGDRIVMFYIPVDKAKGRPFQIQRKEIGCTKKCRTNWDGYCLFQRVI
jgi:hypothetical protein